MVCVLALAPAGGASASSSPWPGYRKCGSFQARYRIHVYARHVSCHTARRVEKEYWLAPESEKELVGPDSYNGYVRLKRFPGWRCTSGAMAGGCRKGRKEAPYSTYNPRSARGGTHPGAELAAARLSSSIRPCGSLAIDYTPVPGEHYSRMYIKAPHSVRCPRARAIMRRYRDDHGPCVGSGCFRDYPGGWTCNAATPGQWPLIQECRRERLRVFGWVKSTIKGPRRAPRARSALERAAGSAARDLPKMLYPTLDYGSRHGGLLWHRWVKPRSWSDGDDISVRHARWLQWNSQRAVAHVRVVIAGQRGRGRVILSEPGYCPAAHAFGFLRETDRGGPWGRGGTFDVTEECDSARPNTSALLRGRTLRLAPTGLGPVRFGMDSAAAERALGHPISVEDGINGCSFWTLPGVGASGQVIARHGRLSYILLFKRGTATTRGIKVGDGLTRLRHRYRGKLHPGRTASLSYAEQRLFVTQHESGAAYEIEFDIVHGRVAFISAATKHVIETFGECA